MPKRVLKGEVVSNATEKTVTVSVERTFSHPKYKKIVRKSKKYRAHDENGDLKVGDSVKIIECKPISKTKRWEVVSEKKA